MAEVVTGEAVVLDLSVARFPSRILAQLLDILIQLPVLVFIGVVIGTKAARHLNGASAAALEIAGLVLVVIAYPVTFETLSRGKTLGKMALGLRVVSDDGGPERFRQALIRGLSAAFIEIWLFPINMIGMPAGLITSMVSTKGKRLGDMFAGTFVIQERVPRRPDLAPAFTFVPPPLQYWAQHLELSMLSDQMAATASSYLRRYGDLRPSARAQIGAQLAADVSAHVSPPPPPGTPPEAYLAAVLTVRRQREQARITRSAAQAAQASPGGGFGQAGAGFGQDAGAGQGQGFGQPLPTATLPLPAGSGGSDGSAGAGDSGGSGGSAGFPPRPAPHSPDSEVTEPRPPAGAPPEDYGFAAPL